MTVLAFPAPASSPAMTEAQMREVAEQDMHQVYGVPVNWHSPERVAIVAFTADPVLAALAADELCRQELGDGLPVVAGGVVIDGPHDVVLLGSPGAGPLSWRQAEPTDPCALTVCVVRPARAGQS